MIVFQELNYDPLKKIRSSRPEVFCEKGVSKNFKKFTGKNLCESLWWLLLKYTVNTVSPLYFNEESDYSEENTCGNEVFRSTIETFIGTNARSSHWRCSAKKSVLQNVTKFTGNSCARGNTHEFCKIFKSNFLAEQFRTAASEMQILQEQSERYCRELDAMLIVSAKIPKREESISPSSFYRHLPDY